MPLVELLADMVNSTSETPVLGSPALPNGATWTVPLAGTLTWPKRVGVSGTSVGPAAPPAALRV
ncbi:hypothetical protein Acsp04_52600 [Actinomadura sp. NBRC 104425]|nr:hypothetical protein Acsp04_52600 [Actinomadura sp. NBRC 104425]